MKRDTTALLKDLELQIDYLIGYSPTGEHWKHEYHIRKNLIDSAITSDLVPDNIKEKILHIQDTIFNLKNGKKHEQNYITYSLADYDIPHEPIRVGGMNGNYII